MEPHVHIHGSALFFKKISQVEDEAKSHFKRLSEGMTLAEAEKEMMAMKAAPAQDSGTR